MPSHPTSVRPREGDIDRSLLKKEDPLILFRSTHPAPETHEIQGRGNRDPPLAATGHHRVPEALAVDVDVQRAGGVDTASVRQRRALAAQDQPPAGLDTQQMGRHCHGFGI